MAKIILCVVVFTLLSVCVYSAPERRGMCLSLCGPYGVDCPTGYVCRGNGCGHECYKSDNYVLPPGCKPLSCDAHCPLGFVTDASGCDTCQCDYSALQQSHHHGNGKKNSGKNTRCLDIHKCIKNQK